MLHCHREREIIIATERERYIYYKKEVCIVLHREITTEKEKNNNYVQLSDVVQSDELMW